MNITKQEYLELLESSIRLSRLEAGGVDNWSWYSESLYPEGDPSIKEEIASIAKTLPED